VIGVDHVTIGYACSYRSSVVCNIVYFVQNRSSIIATYILLDMPEIVYG
jgi:hypothetical protein